MRFSQEGADQTPTCDSDLILVLPVSHSGSHDAELPGNSGPAPRFNI